MYLPRFLVVVALAASAGCDRAVEPATPVADQSVQQAPSALLAGEVVAVAHSGIREGSIPIGATVR